MRYYVDWFFPGYDIEEIKSVTKNAGGINVRTSVLYGWGNQPEVVTFTVYDLADANRIEDKLSNELGVSVIVREKQW